MWKDTITVYQIVRLWYFVQHIIVYIMVGIRLQ